MTEFKNKVNGSFKGRAKRFALRMVKSAEFWAGFIIGGIIGAVLL